CLERLTRIEQPNDRVGLLERASCSVCMPFVGSIETGRVEDFNPCERCDRNENFDAPDDASVNRRKNCTQILRRYNTLRRIVSSIKKNARDRIGRVSQMMQRCRGWKNARWCDVLTDQGVYERALSRVEFTDNCNPHGPASLGAECCEARSDFEIVKRARMQI